MAGFDSKVVLVTGAARGLGLEYATAFHARGARVVLTDVRADLLQMAAARIGPDVTAVAADVSSEQEVAKLFEEIGRLHGRLDILINNAALMLDVATPFKPFWEIEVAEWDRVMAVNARGVFLTCRAARTLMSRGGKIVNITSDAIWQGYAGQLAYFASKGAVAVMTRCLARELGELGINVNAVAPGLTSSQAVNESTFLQEVKPAVIQGRAIKRDQLPEDVVAVVQFLCSDESGAMTGQNLAVNCGGVMR